MCHFRTQNGPFILNKVFLVQTIIITFSYLLALSIAQNLKKFLQRIQSYEDAPFLDPKWFICPKQFFFKYHSHLPISPLHCANFKKIFPADPELWGCTIFGAKMANLPKWGFFSENLLMSLVSFIHAYLHAKNNYIWAPNTMLSFRKN